MAMHIWIKSQKKTEVDIWPRISKVKSPVKKKS